MHRTRLALCLSVAVVQALDAAENRVLELDGDGAHVELPAGIFEHLESVTLEAWVRCERTARGVPVLDLGNAERTIELYLSGDTRTPSRLEFSLWSNIASRMRTDLQLEDVVRSNEWCHVAASCGLGGMKLYFNGMLAATNASTESFRALGSNAHNYIGRGVVESNRAERYFRGQLDEIRVWRVARTEAQIRAAMFTPLSGGEDGLVGLWDFDDGTAKDDARGGHDGALFGQARVVAAERPAAVEQPAIIAARLVEARGQAVLNARFTVAQDAVPIRNPLSIGAEARLLLAIYANDRPYTLEGRAAGRRNAPLSLRLKRGAVHPLDLLLLEDTFSGRVVAMDNTPLAAVVVQALWIESSGLDAVPGLLGEYFDLGLPLRNFPDLPPGSRPRVVRSDPLLDFAAGPSTFAAAGLNAHFYVRWSGRIRIDAAGPYTFFLESDDGSRLFVNNRAVVENGGLHTMLEKAGAVELAVGEHDLIVDYFNGPRNSGCRLSWAGPGIGKQPVPARVLSYSPPGWSTNVVASVTTNEQGEYAFEHLERGRYQVRVHTPNGFVYLRDGVPLDFEPGRPAAGLEFKMPPFKKGTWRQFSYPDGLPHNTITTLYADHDGTLWLGTDGGVARYDGKECVSLTRDDGLAGNIVHSILRDPDGLLWFGTATEGVSRYDEDRRLFLPPLTVADGLAANLVWNVQRDPQGVYWISTRGGLSRYDGRGFVNSLTNLGPINGDVLGVVFGTNGPVWASTRKGLYASQEGVFAAVPGVEGGAPFTSSVMHTTPDGALWFATDTGLWRGAAGTAHDRPGEFVRLSKRDGLLKDAVGAVNGPGDGTLWVSARDDSAITRFDGRCFTHFTAADGYGANAQARAFHGASNGVVWVATHGDGLWRYDPEGVAGFTSKDGLPRDNVRCLRLGPNGFLWVGFGWAGGGASRLNLAATNAAPIAVATVAAGDSLASDMVHAIEVEPDGVVWLGTDRGVSRFDGTAFMNLRSEHEFLNARVSAIHRAADGAVWIGSSQGLVRVDGAGVEGVAPLEFVSGISSTPDGAIWFHSG